MKQAAKRGAHRKRREPSPREGMLLHQDGSDHEWAPGQQWDLIVTMDDATNEHYSMFFCEKDKSGQFIIMLTSPLEVGWRLPARPLSRRQAQAGLFFH